MDQHNETIPAQKTTQDAKPSEGQARALAFDKAAIKVRTVRTGARPGSVCWFYLGF
ncbi:MAG: hypothetical protein ABJE95_06445 [Byssovorax sp.]